MKKTLITILATVLVCACIVGGTLAWLTDKTDTIENTFTVGKVDIELTETTGNTYKMIPGNTITKDPKVTVKAGSEACWVFVKIEAIDVADYLTYTVDANWAALDGVAGVYYIQQNDLSAATDDVSYPVLAGNAVTVKNNVSTISGTPTLKFTAYAIQTSDSADLDTAAEAWAIVSANS